MKPLQLGDVRVHFLSAGYCLQDAGVAYGIVPKALWSRIEPSDEANLIAFQLRSLLVEANGLRILIDNGYGTKLTDRQRANLGIHDEHGLAESLAAIGLEAADIDLVVDTHLHADHCGGNTVERDGRVVAAFPKARYVIDRGEYQVACQPNERTRATYLLDNYVPLVEAGLVDFAEGIRAVTPAVTLEPAPGHTRDHCVVRMSGGGREAIFLADIAQRPVQLERLAWTAAFDVEPLVSLETKRRIVDDAIARQQILIFQHHDGVGRLNRNANGQVGWYPLGEDDSAA